MNFKIFFINLEKNSDRWLKIEKLFSILPSEIKNCLTRVIAFDTSKSLECLTDFNLTLNPCCLKEKLSFFNGAGLAGCYLSHLTAWKKILDEDLDSAMILEDDVAIDDVLSFLLENADIDENLDFIRLGNKLQAYILSKSGAEKLIRLTYDSTPLAYVDPNDEPYNKNSFFKKNDYDFHHQNSMVSCVSNFVSYCCDRRVNDSDRLLFLNYPCISSSKFALYSDTYCCEVKDIPDLETLNAQKIQNIIDCDDFKSFLTTRSITTCICTYNNFDLLQKSFISCMSQDIDEKDYKVIILDNTPLSLLDEKKSSIKDKIKNFCDSSSIADYISLETSGLSEARNKCIDRCETDLIYFIDDDCILHKDSVRKMQSKFFDKKMGVVGGKTIANWSLAPRPTWLSDEQLDALSIIDFGEEDIFLHEYKEAIWLVGANICFRTKALKDIRGFNESLGRKKEYTLLSGEEDEVISKIRKRYHAMYTPDCKAEHIINPKRLDPEWFSKRSAWQAVTNHMTQNFWLRDVEGAKDFLKDNLDKLFKTPQSKSELDIKVRLVLIMTFLLLDGKI